MTPRPKCTCKFPVKVRVTHMREQRYYPTGIDLSAEEYAGFTATHLPMQGDFEEWAHLINHKYKFNMLFTALGPETILDMAGEVMAYRSSI